VRWGSTRGLSIRFPDPKRVYGRGMIFFKSRRYGRIEKRGIRPTTLSRIGWWGRWDLHHVYRGLEPTTLRPCRCRNGFRFLHVLEYIIPLVSAPVWVWSRTRSARLSGLPCCAMLEHLVIPALRPHRSSPPNQVGFKPCCSSRYFVA
jgi:hypothetical protein